MGVRRNTSKSDPSAYLPIEYVNTQAATGIDEMLANIKKNILDKHVRLHELPEYKQIKGHQNPIILVGGGPSIKKPEVLAELHRLAKKWPIIVAGSAHDWLIQQGIHPQYTAVCDPDPVSALYLKETNKNPYARYLLASSCAQATYDAVPRERIAMWHCHSEAVQDGIQNMGLEPQYHAVGGGCTVGLRAIGIAMMLGYTNMHFFGFDSCMETKDEHHAYEFVDESKEFLGQTYEIKLQKVGKDEGGRSYLVAGYQLAQASQFREFAIFNRHVFTPTFYGGGLLADIYKTLLAEEQLQSERAA